MNDRDDIADWMLTVQGRLARIAAGTVLILVGLAVVGGFLGVLLLILGAVPIASAAYGTLLIGPLLGRDIRGRRRSEQPRDEQPDDAGEEAEGGGAAREDESKPDSEPASGDESRPAQKESGAPPLARAERPPGQGPRTKDPREGDSG